MKPIYFILLTLLGSNCISQKKNTQREIAVESNYNIHTQLILEHLVWPGKRYPNRPMITEVIRYFDKYKDHPAIHFTDSLLRNKIFFSDELMEISLYLEPLPSTKFKYSIENTPYNDRIALINEWKQKVSDFYIVSDVEGFMKSNKQFYDGAIKEVVNNLPPNDFIDQMETFYRDKKLKYTIIPCPEMKTGDKRGVGPYVQTKEGMLVYQIISASIPIQNMNKLSDCTEFGFNNREYILLNARHEFGHSFVNPLLERADITELLNKYEKLFTRAFEKVMGDQNYGTWWDCVAEHLVRLGEIRIADRSGDSILATKLRFENIEKKRFIFLPELEEKVKQYESNKMYKSFLSYLPELINTLEQFNVQKINSRILED